MLNHIHIRDFAIIDELDLDLHTGMSVLTGETGAGKSILIDALGLALGDRADADVVRQGCKRAEIIANFELADLPEAQAWLEENELDDDSQCLIRRTIAAEGRSRGFINGTPVPIQSLRALGEMLVDIHGQHEHQSLMRVHAQRELLDDYAQHGSLLKQLACAYKTWNEANDEYERLRQAASDRDTRLDFLRYQVQELETLAPQEDEHAELEQEHVRLANVSRLQDTAHRHIEALDDNEQISATALLSRAVSELDGLREMDGRLGDIADSLNSALTNVEDASKELRHYLDSLDADPARLSEIDSRLGSFLDLARKHHVKPGELLHQLDELSNELDSLQHAETRLEGLQTEIGKHFTAYSQLADKLGKSRRKHARTLAKQVTGHMQELGMPGGHFDIVLHARDQAVPSAEGMEKVEFMVSANPGQALRPLNKVASGGELSRISLAIQVVLANNVRIPTLIFDEVDVGIGGGVAEIVGNRLRSLADNRQVLCVTHLPQVASQAHHHLQVSKTRGKAQTGTHIQALDETARGQEIARMLGGVEITEQTLAHAKEMLSKAN
ncbi:DNA repair protein RecN [Sulfuriflexus sp.]|uniref:DNA repair protein RecN n=1 Tax=Sulfuriflexus sp. TaxID=2015443 RepID=UPI0028CFD4B6|nr:DNA repair protein RecN [Sulfuriflexus sp.]MDT8404833.1 DNA repair protein RecN [Sulfuriflexus sp.]